MYILMILMLMNSFLLNTFKHPLSCGMILLTQTMMTSLITGMMMNNFWYSYILFLIMIGGMLILFIYMTSIASNEKFKFNTNIFMSMMLFLMMMMMSFFLDSFYSNLLELTNLFNLKTNFIISFKKYLNFPNYFLLMMMIIYLFITLILVVKITKISYGPLRQKF